MAYWIDSKKIHSEDNMLWRFDSGLLLNKGSLQHYNETSDARGHSNRVWFDDTVVSTSRIGCN